MECFRIDESGYTGFDLLNAEQPFQGDTAIAIGNDDAARLIKEHFPTLQAAELKCSSLTRRASNYSRVLAVPAVDRLMRPLGLLRKRRWPRRLRTIRLGLALAKGVSIRPRP